MSDAPNNPLLPAEMKTRLDAALANKDRPNGMTDDQIRRFFAIAGRRRPDPEYLKLMDEGIAEYRREIQEELERDLAEGSKK